MESLEASVYSWCSITKRDREYRLNPVSKQGRKIRAQGQPLIHKNFRPAWAKSQKEKQQKIAKPDAAFTCSVPQFPKCLLCTQHQAWYTVGTCVGAMQIECKCLLSHSTLGR